MTTVQLKSNFHKLIDNIGNATLLEKFYEIMSNGRVMQQDALWAKLTDDEQQELLSIVEDSENEANLPEKL